MTTAIQTELSSRKQEISEFIELLGKFESGAYVIQSESSIINYPVIVRTTQKSCVILLLYNAIESTVTRLLTHLHDSIIDENISFFELNDDMRDMTITYINSVTEKSNNREAAPYVRKFLDFAFDKCKYAISYQEMTNYYQLYSGNLDAEEIRSTLKKYGIIFEKRTSELQSIKDGRNTLAHGDESFAEYGRDLTHQQINNLFVKVFEYLEELIMQFDNFITTKAFKKI